jgi:predicted protein tyrosine phosphatase
MKKILFICTSNKDRSPILEKYFRANYPENEYKSAGVNLYNTTRHGTHYLTEEDIIWADLLIFAEDIQLKVIKERFKAYDDRGFLIFPKLTDYSRQFLVLNCGEYDQKDMNSYLERAKEKLYFI